jgi:aminoglycoside phosphotransferase (APT) family kinase protein
MTAPELRRTDRARELLCEEFPRLRIESIEAIGDGWDHVAYLVNGDVVFRVPWELLEGERVDPAHEVAREVALLRAVAGLLPVRVPEPVAVAGDGTYFGYRYLPGRAILDGVDAWKGAREQRALVELVLDVALGIEQAVPVADALALGLEARISRPNDLAKAAAGLASGLVSRHVCAVAESVLADYPDRWDAAVSRRMATLHADLGLDHWLLDGYGQVYALIDWSDACVAPPEHQLATLRWHIPELAGAAAAGYAARTRAEIDAELVVADAYACALSDLAELLDEGDPDDEADIAWYVQLLERWAQQGTSAGQT